MLSNDVFRLFTKKCRRDTPFFGSKHIFCEGGPPVPDPSLDIEEILCKTLRKSVMDLGQDDDLHKK